MIKRFLPLLAVILFIIPVAVFVSQNSMREQTFSVLVAYHPEYAAAAPGILEAYESVLQEEGIPAERIDVHDIGGYSVETLSRRSPVMILPDAVLQNLPETFKQWAGKYLALGGNLLVVYDVGIKDQKGSFLQRSALADVVGLNTITYAEAGERSFGYGSIRFISDEGRDLFQIPPGKTDGLVLSGYRYGRLRYPLAENTPAGPAPGPRVYAYADMERGGTFPAIVKKEYAQGTVLYVDLPLGYLKANADDLPLRSVIRTFLFTLLAVPHVMNVENGLGAIIINWHIDSNIEHATLARMRKSGLLRTDVPASFHITAGDYCYAPGDDAGFDACGKGKALVELLKPYGSIGSHGGWGHNWFADNIKRGVFHESDMRLYIEKNNACLESITGRKIVEYSAPDGVQPQPTTARLLERMGFTAFYATGDTGSPPLRAFLNGSMLSPKTIAFPIMPFGRSASLDEMYTLDHRTEREVRDWLLGLLTYVSRNRTARLVYSHPNNIDRYPQAVKRFIARAAELQQRDELSVRTMGNYASFFLRFLKTTYSFRRSEDRLTVMLDNPDGLAGVSVAVPKQSVALPASDIFTVREDDRYYYLTVVRNDKTVRIRLDAR